MGIFFLFLPYILIFLKKITNKTMVYVENKNYGAKIACIHKEITLK
jgi:hypothetical protein